MTLREIAAIALDEAANVPPRKGTSLAEHDRRHHPDGYREGDSCKYREALANGDDADRISLGGWRGRVSIEVCDITKQDVDAIVNAANRVMLGGGGVDGAIHREAGEDLKAACAQFPVDEHGFRLQTGEAKITPGFRLKARHVIHTVGPDANTAEGAADLRDGERLLRAAYRNSLELARDSGCKSVAFPSISTGIFAYPLERAARAAAEEIGAFLAENPNMTVMMCIFDPFDSDRIVQAYEDAFDEVEAQTQREIETLPETDVTDETEEVRNLRQLLRTNAIGKREFATALAALASMGKVSRAQLQAIKRQVFAADEEIAYDEALTDMQRHDAKYHGGHYDGKGACKYREALAKGDSVDILDPENVEGEKPSVQSEGLESSGSADAGKPPIQALEDAKSALAKSLKANDLKGVGDACDAYEKAYNSASSGSAMAEVADFLEKQMIIPMMDDVPECGFIGILQQEVAGLRSQSSVAANLPEGTPTPAEVRNGAAMAIAQMLKANLTVQGATRAPKTQKSETPPKEEIPPNDEEPPGASQSKQAQPAATQPPQGIGTFGPKPPLTIYTGDFPSRQEFNFKDYGKRYAGWISAGTGSTNPHSIVINGTKYWVKRAGTNPSYTNEAAENEVNANKFIRLAGFNAPKSELYNENGVNYCVTLDSPYIGSSSPNGDAAEFRAAYPLMALLYSTDAMMNDNTKRDADGLVFLDNGSSFGFSAQGNRPNPNIPWEYDARTEPDSAKNQQSGIMALASHPSQQGWRTAFGGRMPSQDDVLKEAAKYDMGGLVREAAKRGLLNHLPSKGVASLQAFADRLDRLSAKYRKPSPAQAAQSQSAASAVATQPPSSATSPSPGAATSTGQQTGGWKMPVTPVKFDPNNRTHSALASMATPSWTTPTRGMPSNQMRNGHGIIAAIATAKIAPYSVIPPLYNSWAARILTKGIFTANARGIGGTVTGANLPRRGIQAFQKSLNSILNPQGLNMQVHNNGDITFSATNRAIAKSALEAAGIAVAEDAAPDCGVFAMALDEALGIDAGRRLQTRVA